MLSLSSIAARGRQMSAGGMFSWINHEIKGRLGCRPEFLVGRYYENLNLIHVHGSFQPRSLFHLPYAYLLSV